MALYTKQDYEREWSKQFGYPMLFSDEQYQRLLKGQLLTSEEIAASRPNVYSGFEDPPGFVGGMDAATGKAKAPPKRYDGFEEDGKGEGGMDANTGKAKAYAAAFRPQPEVETAANRATVVGQNPWQSGNPTSALEYAALSGTRSSNHARWDEDQERWVTEWEDTDRTKTGMAKGGALGQEMRAAKRQKGT